jgi:hypothetical protein
MCCIEGQGFKFKPFERRFTNSDATATFANSVGIENLRCLRVDTPPTIQLALQPTWPYGVDALMTARCSSTFSSGGSK